jgi:hypothetical protein
VLGSLCAGADQASRTASGATGLHIAANSGSADIIADLLESSEDLDPDDDGAYNCESQCVALGTGLPVSSRLALGPGVCDICVTGFCAHKYRSR